MTTIASHLIPPVLDNIAKLCVATHVVIEDNGCRSGLIYAIKMFRVITGCGLKESKDAIEAVTNQIGGIGEAYHFARSDCNFVGKAMPATPRVASDERDYKFTAVRYNADTDEFSVHSPYLRDMDGAIDDAKRTPRDMADSIYVMKVVKRVDVTINVVDI